MTREAGPRAPSGAPRERPAKGLRGEPVVSTGPFHLRPKARVAVLPPTQLTWAENWTSCPAAGQEEHPHACPGSWAHTGRAGECACTKTGPAMHLFVRSCGVGARPSVARVNSYSARGGLAPRARGFPVVVARTRSLAAASAAAASSRRPTKKPRIWYCGPDMWSEMGRLPAGSTACTGHATSADRGCGCTERLPPTPAPSFWIRPR